MVPGESWLRLTCLCFAVSCLIEEEVSWALGTEGQDQVLCQGWDDGQGEHRWPVPLGSQHRFQTSYLQQTEEALFDDLLLPTATVQRGLSQHLGALGK